MILNQRAKGYFFAFLSVLATSNVYIFSKAALETTPVAVFGVYWFAMGLLWNLLYSIKTRQLIEIKSQSKRNILILVVLGLLETGGTTFFFLAIQAIPNPAVVSFLSYFNPVFITILGTIILKDRYNYWEILGIGLIMTGAFVISYQGGTKIESMFIHGSHYMILSALFYGVSAIIAKKSIQKISPTLLATSRSLNLLVFSVLMVLLLKESWVISNYSFWNIFIGSILGPFLTTIAGYYAFKYLEVSRVSILGSTKGIFVLIGAFIYFGRFPLPMQLVGGLLAITGVILISFGKLMLKKKST